MVNEVKKMKNIYIIVLALITLLILSSCSDFTSSARFDGDAYAISGLLVANSSINSERPIYVCRSSSITDFNAMELFVTDAQITIKEMIDTLVVKSFPLYFDSLAVLPMKYIDPAGNIIQADRTYRIEVRIPGYSEVIWAETKVPKQATLVPDYFGINDPEHGYSTDPDTDLRMRYDDIDTSYPLALEMGDFVGPQYFFTELFCMEPFSTDLEFTTPVFGFTHADETMRNSYYSSGESVRRIQIMGKYASQYQEDTQANYLMVRDYKQAFVFYGRYKVTAFVVDKNYYEYSFMPEGYLYGGVHNGLGYFGSASGGTMYTRISKD